ncbi:MAG TPA: hypothetical protein VKV25_10970 [Acidimicrobiales bacterium]|nr:hypothetical protein [Acidimicrobiales bacterium]
MQTRLPDHEVVAAARAGDPTRLAESEGGVRRALRLPPYVALAAVSGPGGADYAGRLRAAAGGGVEVVGPDPAGRWLVRSPGPGPLCDLLAATARPAARVRVEVDPVRL